MVQGRVTTCFNGCGSPSDLYPPKSLAWQSDVAVRGRLDVAPPALPENIAGCGREAWQA